jgi:hypothetical protein
MSSAVFCLVVVEKQSDAGTTSALTPIRITPGSETLQSTARHSASGEPTSAAVIHRLRTNVGASLLKTPEDFIVLAGGERLGVKVTSASSVNITTTIIYEE